VKQIKILRLNFRCSQKIFLIVYELIQNRNLSKRNFAHHAGNSYSANPHLEAFASIFRTAAAISEGLPAIYHPLPSFYRPLPRFTKPCPQFFSGCRGFFHPCREITEACREFHCARQDLQEAAAKLFARIISKNQNTRRKQPFE